MNTRSVFVYVTCALALSTTAYSIFAVPYVAMPAEMSDDSEERTVIVSYRMGFAIAGILLGSALAPMLVARFGSGRRGYSIMGACLGVFCGLSMLFSFFFSHSLRLHDQPDQGRPFWQQAALAFKNRPFFVLQISYVVQMAAVSTFYGSLPYFTVYILGRNEGDVGPLLFTTFSVSIIAMSLWVRVSQRVGKKSALVAAILIYGLALMMLSLSGPMLPTGIFYGYFLLIGVGFAGLQLFPFSMLTDTIEIDFRHNGMRREGLFTGLWIAGEKAGLALGPLVAGSLLQGFGFKALEGGGLQQSASALVGIRFASSICPAVLLGFGALLVLRYPSHVATRPEVTPSSVE